MILISLLPAEEKSSSYQCQLFLKKIFWLSVGVTGSQDFAMDESGVITASAAEGAGEGEE